MKRKKMSKEEFAEFVRGRMQRGVGMGRSFSTKSERVVDPRKWVDQMFGKTPLSLPKSVNPEKLSASWKSVMSALESADLTREELFAIAGRIMTVAGDVNRDRVDALISQMDDTDYTDLCSHLEDIVDKEMEDEECST